MDQRMLRIGICRLINIYLYYISVVTTLTAWFIQLETRALQMQDVQERTRAMLLKDYVMSFSRIIKEYLV